VLVAGRVVAPDYIEKRAINRGKETILARRQALAFLDPGVAGYPPLQV
jgi:hypothetical protein